MNFALVIPILRIKNQSDRLTLESVTTDNLLLYCYLTLNRSVSSGSCPEGSLLTADQCRFAHHWIPDSSDVLDEEALELEDAIQMLLREDGPVFLLVFAAVLTLLVVVVKTALKLATSSRSRQKTD